MNKLRSPLKPGASKLRGIDVDYYTGTPQGCRLTIDWEGPIDLEGARTPEDLGNRSALLLRRVLSEALAHVEKAIVSKDISAPVFGDPPGDA